MFFDCIFDAEPSLPPTLQRPFRQAPSTPLHPKTTQIDLLSKVRVSKPRTGTQFGQRLALVM